LTPTSEVELHNLYRDETIPEEKLPIHITAWTACFPLRSRRRRKDTRGILRQHQFQKVELFKFTHPEKSYEEHEALVRNAETILQKLGLHYRTVLPAPATWGSPLRKPTTSKFGCLRATNSARSPRARIAKRFNPAAPAFATSQGRGKSDFVHTLNGPGSPSGRTWIAVVENYQQPEGSILIPEVLRPYMELTAFQQYRWCMSKLSWRGYVGPSRSYCSLLNY